MACASCGRRASAPRITRNTGTTATTSGKTIQVEATAPRVQTAVASNPNSPPRTKI